ncbi:hypothetical protein P7C70_g4011, partial [Phenoliferia sp. Uapishka_3]
MAAPAPATGPGRSRAGSTSGEVHAHTVEPFRRTSDVINVGSFQDLQQPSLNPGLGATRSVPHRRASFQTSPTPAQGPWPTLSSKIAPPIGLLGLGSVGTRRGLSGGPPSRLSILRNLFLRPLYIFSRRGPFAPVLVLALFLLFFLTYSTNARTLRVKKRMRGVVNPFIPGRAAAAFSWSESAQHPILPITPIEGVTLNVGKARHPTDVKADVKTAKDTVASWGVLPKKRKDGRVPLVEGETHPIILLMLRAKKQWAALKARQSKTFAGAVNEYVKRNGRKPPKGFDQWFAFAKAHKVLLIDEFDLINNDLKVFRAFTPQTFRDRVAALQTSFDMTWTITIKDGKPLREGPLAGHNRAAGVVDLVKRFVHTLPDMQIVYNGHDGARIAIAHEERMRLEALAITGLTDDSPAPFWPVERGPPPHHSLPVFCDPNSAMRAPDFDYGWPNMTSTGLEMPELITGSSGSVLDDFKGYMDVCTSPQYRHFHAATSWVYSHHPTPVLPLLTPGVPPKAGDIHAIIVEQLDLVQEHDPTWEQRPFASLQWRGQTSGPLWEATTPWISTQRARLHLLSHQESGKRKFVVTDENDKMRAVEEANYRINPLFLDVGMIGPAVQCVQEDGTCAKMEEVFQGYDKRMSFDRAALYKYALGGFRKTIPSLPKLTPILSRKDVDGNSLFALSWSGRFRRLMLSNAAVVKATIFPEFWTDWAIRKLNTTFSLMLCSLAITFRQVDYSDMWDIMAFFRGGLNGEGAHDSLGKDIADAGKDWVRDCYRWVDLEAYQYRLMLEYGRLYTDETEPGSNDYNGDA